MLNNIYEKNSELDSLQIELFDSNSKLRYLWEGTHTIQLADYETGEGIGIIPAIGVVKHIKTEGLRWECDFGLQIGKFISTCNKVKEGNWEIKIETTDPVLFVSQIK